MEQNNIPMTTKRFWNILRGVMLVLRKGVSKPKLLMLDLDVMVKRGKIAGKNMMHNLMFHHHHQVPSAEPQFNIEANDEYEFSCDTTPVHVFKRKQNGAGGAAHSNFFSCANAPRTEGDDDDEEYAIAQSPAVQAFLRSPMVMEMMCGQYNNINSEASSPALPGFGRTPIVRQLRVTDSPFGINEIVEENSCVDAKANEFIAMFYEQLRKQNSIGRRLR